MANYAVAVQVVNLSSTNKFGTTALAALTAPAGFAIFDQILDFAITGSQDMIGTYTGNNPSTRTVEVRSLWRDA